jgi:hypothetical protein
VIVLASSPLHTLATIFGAVLTAIGLIFLLVGFLIRAIGRRFRGPGERVEGKIVGFDATDPGMIGRRGGIRISGWTAFGNQIIYRPTVEFTTADGTAVRATSSVGSNPRHGNVGDPVTVHYDPRNPQRMRIDSPGGASSCLEGGFMVLGGAVAAIGIIVLIAGR